VDVGTALQEFSRGDNILIFGCAATSAARRFAEGAAVADAAAVIERENDVAAAGEILIHGIGIRVVVHVVPAEKHLANRPTVKKNQRGTLFAWLCAHGNKELAVDFEAVSRFEDGLLGSDKSVGGK